MPIVMINDVGPATGALPGNAVWVQYFTQHDGKVRPSHAALHEKVFRLDDPNVPIPPIDYGCRCYITYVAAPTSEPAREVLDEAPEAPTTVAASFAEALDKELPQWRKAMEETASAPPARRLSLLFLALRKLAPKAPASDVRDYARMALEASRGPQ